MRSHAVDVKMYDTPGLGRCAAHILLWLVAVAFLAPSTSPAQGTLAQAGDYVGAEQCSDCHFVYFQQFQKTPMSLLLSDKYPPEQRGCEGFCHGPGRAHKETERIKKGEVDKMTEAEKAKAAFLTEEEKDAEALAARLSYSLKRLSPKDISARCLSCHQKDEKQGLFRRSRHLGAGVACTECHDPHLIIGNIPRGEGVARPSAALETYFSVPKRSFEHDWAANRLLREGQPQLCYSCHRDVEAQFQLPVRHRVNEGLVKCTDCHNPHGSLTPREINATGSEACYRCHIGKRGPFVYEHGPIRVEGCTGCHTPHGSINLHLLKRRRESQLCLECHVAPQSTNVPHPRVAFTPTGECTQCHIEIHGSNYQRQFLR